MKSRGVGRKIDPQTKIIYHPEFNPIPDIKGFSDKLIEIPNIEEPAVTDNQQNQ